jgi:asparagine synthase (glutamine-hydrolysing)
LRHLIQDAIKLRLRADVPIALALSGGIDSSVIAAELAEAGAPPSTFTVVVDGVSSDPPHAQSVAQQFALPHHAIEPEDQPLPDQMETVCGMYDEPFADSSAFGCAALARSLAGKYKVILNGDGGDEAFGGYRHYEFISAKQTVKAAAAAMGLRDGQGISTYVQSKTTFRAKERAALLNGYGQQTSTLDEFLRSDSFLQKLPAGSLKRALWSDRHLPLANGLMYKTDIAFGAYGLEGRAPLLDYRILEWSQNLPDRDLVRGREKKVLLRDSYRGILPDSILSRPKQGFGAPIEQWLAGPLRDQANAVLPCPLLDPDVQRDLTGQRRWALFSFAMWARRWRATW